MRPWFGVRPPGPSVCVAPEQSSETSLSGLFFSSVRGHSSRRPPCQADAVVMVRQGLDRKAGQVQAQDDLPPDKPRPLSTSLL